MKTALITGASRGIGHAIACKFAQLGYDTVLTSHNSINQLQMMCREFSEKYGTNHTCVCGDISDEAFVDSLFAPLDELDVLINNAGVSYVGLLQDMELVHWNKLMAVNLTSAFLTSRRAIPYMLKKGAGSIINISSMWGVSGASMEVAYSAAKGGLNTMTRALAKELAPSNIQVNALSCGVVDTQMNDFLSEEERAELMEQIPIGRFADPKEVAEAVISIVNAGPYMTGQVIGFDGGFL